MTEVPGTIVDNPKRPWKALVPVIIGCLYAIVEAARIAYTDAVWDTNDTITVVLAGVTALGVYLTRNPKTFANGLSNNAL